MKTLNPLSGEKSEPRTGMGGLGKLLLVPAAVAAVVLLGSCVGTKVKKKKAGFRLTVLAGAALFYVLLAVVPIAAGGDARAHMANLEGAALYRDGDLAGAEARFRKALEFQPGDAVALCNLGRVLADRGKTDQALEYYRRALLMDPRQAETYLNLEEMYRNAGRREEALEILDRLEKARGGHLADAAAPVAYRRGVNLFALGDTTAAVQQLEKAVAIAPDMVGPWLTLSIIERKLHDSGKALLAAKRAAALSPDDETALVVLGAAFLAAGKPLEAAGAYQKALKLDPTDREIRFRVGHALVEAGKDELAEPYLVDANEGKPHPEALWDLGGLYERQGRSEEARTVYQTLIRIGAPQRDEARRRLQELGASPRRGRR